MADTRSEARAGTVSEADHGRRAAPSDIGGVAVGAVLLGILLVGFGLRVFRLAQFGLSGDEALGARFVYAPLAEILASTTSGDPHPPLFYLLLRGWARAFGDSEFSLRFLSVSTGLLVLPLAHRIGSWLFGRPVGLVAALLLAVHPYQIWYAHEVRMYMPLTLFATLSVAALVSWRRNPRARAIALWVAFSVPLAYTHYYGVILIACESVFVVGEALVGRLSGGRGPAAERRPLRSWLIAQAIVGVTFLPWAYVAQRIIGAYNALGWAGPDRVVAEALVRYSVGHTWDWPGGVAVGGAFAAFGAGGLLLALIARPSGPAVGAASSATRNQAVASRATGRWSGWLLLVWAALPLAIGLAGSFARPMLTPRYLLVSATAFAICLALAVVALFGKSRLLGALLLIGLLGVSGQSLLNLYVDPQYARDGYGRLVEYVVAHSRPDQGIIVAAYTQQDQFWYYYRHRANGQLRSYQFPVAEPPDAVVSAREIDRVMREQRGVWYIATDSARYDPNRISEQILTTGHHRVLERWFNGDRLVYFASPGSSEPPARHKVGSFGNEIGLVGVAIAPDRIAAGEPLLVTLYWEATARPQKAYKISLALLDPDGHTLIASDREPGGGFLPTDRWESSQLITDRWGLPVPDSAPPGEYSLVARVYEPNSGVALSATRADGSAAGDTLALAQVKLAAAAGTPLAESRGGAPLDARFGVARLVGVDPIADVEYVTGGQIETRLFWQDARGIDGRLRLEFVAADGTSAANSETDFAPGWSPTAAWPPNRVVGAQRVFAVPPRLASGLYVVRLSLHGAPGGDGGVPVDIGRVRVVAPAREFAPPSASLPLGSRFGEVAALVGLDAASSRPSLRPGETLRATVHWRATSEPTRSYKVFAHLVGPDGAIHGQQDKVPLDGRRPTTGWVSGEYLADEFAIRLTDDAPAGGYVLRIGLYDEASGQRLPVAGGGDFVDTLRFDVVR